MYKDSHYKDEDIDFSGDGNDSLPDGIDSIHSWDYFAPEDDEFERFSDSLFYGDINSGFNSCQPVSGLDFIDEPFRTLMRMIREQPWQFTASKAFYNQAMFMADYEEDAPIVGFMNYFPSYRDMSLAQLRSYFSIRRQLRLGKFPDVSLSYIFVYVYETLMKIGVNTAEEGYEILNELNEAYRSSEPKLCKYLTPWIRDYVVYNNLSCHYAEAFSLERKQDEISSCLSSYGKTDADTLFTTVCNISKYDIRKGALFSQEKNRVVACAAYVLKSILPVLEKDLHHRMTTLFAGKRVKRPVKMFSNALFYDPSLVRKVEVEVSPLHRYFCQSGLWTRDEYVGENKSLGRILGNILRETDCQLRNAFGVKPRIKPLATGEAYRRSIHDAICKWLDEDRIRQAREDAERRRVSIDFAKLRNIRNDANIVKDKLLDGIVLEEDTATPIEAPCPNPATTHHPQVSSDDSNEHHFLHLILDGGDWHQYLRSIHVPEGVMVENVNNEMMDIIGDIVLEDNGGDIRLIEDYRSDIERIIYNNE